jgi:CBS domain-containing protein
MTITFDSLLALDARDLMSPHPVVLPAEMLLATAARLLNRQQISGAPVTDERGRCVGVISATDFMRCAGNDKLPRRFAETCNPISSEWEIPMAENVPPGAQVRDFMTADPVTVPDNLPLVEMARTLIDAHIHRVIVVDEDGHPVGVVTTSDILAALVRFADRSAIALAAAGAHE